MMKSRKLVSLLLSCLLPAPTPSFSLAEQGQIPVMIPRQSVCPDFARQCLSLSLLSKRILASAPYLSRRLHVLGSRRDEDSLDALFTPDADGNYPRTMMLSDGKIPPGIRAHRLYAGRAIAVLERVPGEATVYVGNKLAAFKNLGNRVRIISVQDPQAWLKLMDHTPDVIFANDQDDSALDLIKGYGRPRKRDMFVEFYFPQRLRDWEHENRINPRLPNMAVTASEDIVQQVIRSFRAHKSQFARTLYDVTMDFFARATARYARALGLTTDAASHAQTFYVCRLSDIKKDRFERWVIHQQKREIFHQVFPGEAGVEGMTSLRTGGVEVLNDPHPDDVPIAAGYSVRLGVQAGVDYHEIIYGSGHAGLPTLWQHRARAMGLLIPKMPRVVWSLSRLPRQWWREEIWYYWQGAIRDAKITKPYIRTIEASESANILQEDAAGRIHLEHPCLDLLLDDDDNKNFEGAVQVLISLHRRAYLAHVKKVLSFDPVERPPFQVTLPHPEDVHGSHINTTQAVYEALTRLSSELHWDESTIYLKHYTAPWALSVRANTYFQSKTNVDTPNAELAELHEMEALRKQGSAPLNSELTGRLGMQSYPMDVMGGPFSEATRRERIPWNQADFFSRQAALKALKNKRGTPPRDYMGVLVDRMGLRPVWQGFVRLFAPTLTVRALHWLSGAG